MPRMLKVPEGGREVYIKQPQTKNRHNPLLYRLLQPAKLRRSDSQVTLCLFVFILSLSLTLLKLSEFSSTAHCPWGTSLAKLQNPATTSSSNQCCPEVSFHQSYGETECHLIHSVIPRLQTFSPFWYACFLSPQPSWHSELCCSPYTENNLTTIIFCQFTVLQTKEERENVSQKTCPLRLIINTQCFFVFFVVEVLLLIFSVCRFFVPDCPLLVPTPFLSMAPLHGMTFPFLSDRNPLWTHSNQTSGHFFFQNNRTAMFSVQWLSLIHI